LKFFRWTSDIVSSSIPTVYDTAPSINSGERVVGFSELLRIEGTKYEAAAVKERIELTLLNRVLNIGTTVPVKGSILSLETASCQYICLIADPAAIVKMMRGLRGSPSATIGAEFDGATAETRRRLRRGSARPLATIPYCIKTSRLRSPTKRDVLRGDSGPLINLPIYEFDQLFTNGPVYLFRLTI
jgi:hypothetical protein